MVKLTAAELTARREALGLSQRQLAERFGVHYMTISKWERDMHRIPEMVDLALSTLERRTRPAGAEPRPAQEATE